MARFNLLIAILCTIHSLAHAQQGIRRHYEPYNHFWTGIDVEHRISERVRIGIDVPYRRQSLDKGSLKIYEHLHWTGFRLWSTIPLSEKVFLNISPLAYFYEVPPANEQEGLNDWQDEIRFSVRLRYAPEGALISHRYGIERRYRRDHEKNYRQEYRIRYLLRLTKPISEKWTLTGANEVFINIGEDIAYNIFDMNRIFIGFRKELSPGLKMDVGYQNLLDLLSSGDEFNVIHSFILTFSLNSLLNE